MKKIRITINGRTVITTEGKTILEAVNENKIDTIPTLCHDERIEPYGSCFLCVVEIEGLNKLVPACSTPVKEGLVIFTNNEKIQSVRKTALELLLSNHYADCIAPCIDNCPAGVDVHEYIALASAGKFTEAIRLIKETNPFPLSLGRICVRNCEIACRRNFVDEPVAINAVKRYLADEDNKHIWTPVTKKPNHKKIAIIGGGPSGLTCAYYLTLGGYSATIFEKLPELGGMLKYGIPEYRLPKKILDTEIKWMTDLGIDVKTGMELGKDFSIDDLKNKGYESVFLAVGAHKATGMRLDGEDRIDGIIKGIDFLREKQNNKMPNLKGTVIVVGGGNTALDCARTSLRMGVGKVIIVYRRSIKEMPAHPDEVEAAEKEGIEILFLSNPVSIIEKLGRLTGVECIKMKLEEAEPGERARPVPIPGSEFILNCDYMIAAIGQQVDTSFIDKDKDCKLEKWGTIVVDQDTLQTSIPGVFAGGDVVTGPLTAINSIAQGKIAAYSIDEFLRTGAVKKKKGKFLSFKNKLGEISQYEFDHIKKVGKEKMPELPVVKRKNNFEEVELGFSENQLMLETKRCMECGCSEFYDCTLRKLADDFNIDISQYSGETRKYKIDDRHPFIVLDPNKCINCGRCVRTCSEILKVSAIGFLYRGFRAIVKPAMEKALLETNCISCGNCIDTCPTGAMAEKFLFKPLGQYKKENYESICNFCSIGCRINYKVIRDNYFFVSNSTISIRNSHNNGYLCVKGRFGHRYLLDGNRIIKPVIRKNGIRKETGIEEAIDYTAEKINRIIQQYGPGSIAVFGSPKLSNEELYLLQKFTRVGLKSNHISSFTNLFRDSELNCLDESLGITASTTTMDDLSGADIILAVNANLTDDNMIMELKIKAAQKKGAAFIYVNSSELNPARFSDLWVDSKKGTNTVLLNGILKEIIENDDLSFGSEIKNFPELKEMVSAYNADIVATLTGLSQERYKQLVDMVKNPASNIIFIYNIDSRREKSFNDLKAIGNFLLLTNRINKKHNGVIILRDYSNSTGLLDMGVTPEYLPGYVKFHEIQRIRSIGKEWGVNMEEIFKPVNIAERIIRNQIKAILIFGEDPLAIPDNIKYFDDLDFLMVQDMFNTETAKKAEVVLPASAYIEQDGTYTSCDRRVQEAIRVFNDKGTLENWRIITNLAKKFGGNFNYNSNLDIFNEIRKINRCYTDVKPNDFWGKDFSGQSIVAQNREAGFAIYDTDIVTYSAGNETILYSENYYRSKIKKKIT